MKRGRGREKGKRAIDWNGCEVKGGTSGNLVGRLLQIVYIRSWSWVVRVERSNEGGEWMHLRFSLKKSLLRISHSELQLDSQNGLYKPQLLQSLVPLLSSRYPQCPSRGLLSSRTFSSKKRFNTHSFPSLSSFNSQLGSVPVGRGDKLAKWISLTQFRLKSPRSLSLIWTRKIFETSRSNKLQTLPCSITWITQTLVDCMIQLSVP